MKKIFSFVCAMAIALCASAAQLASEAQLAKKAVVAEQMQGVQLENVQVANFYQLSATPAIKPAARKLATAEPIVVIIKGKPQIVSKSGNTTVEVVGDDDINYGWVIAAESLEAGKTYTYADMGAHNVYRYDQSFTVYEEATDATFSIDAENNITASMVTESGTYMVYTTAPQPAPAFVLADTYEGNGFSVSKSGLAPLQPWKLKTGTTTDGTAYLDGIIPAFSAGGSYKLAYTVVDDSVLVIKPAIVGIYQNMYYISIESGTASEIRFIAGKDGALKLANPQDTIIYGAYDISYKYQGCLGMFTGLTYTPQAPITERDTVDVKLAMNINDLTTASKLVIYYGDNEDYYIFRVAANTEMLKDSTYKWSEGGINNANSFFSIDGQTKNYFQDGEFTVATDDNGIALTGWMIGEDEKYYRLDLYKQTHFDKRDTVTVNADNLRILAQQGVGYVYLAANADYSRIQFVVDAEQPFGTFAMKDGKMEYGYQYVEDNNGKGVLFLEGEMTVAETKDGYTLTGLFVGSDEKAYVFNLIYTKPAPKDTVEIVCSNMQIEDLTEELGYFAYAGGDKDHVAYLYAVTDTAYGTFKLANGVILVNNGTQTPDTVRAVEGEITISAEDKVATLTGSMLGNDTILYTFSWTGKVGVLSFDSDEDFDGEFNLEEADIKTQTGMISLSVSNEFNQVVNLMFFANLTEDNTIPAGVYVINDSQEEGTVLASIGLYAQSGRQLLMPSYAALSSDQGITDAWFMVSGVVEVAEDGSIKVEALNSYDRNITITIANPSTGLFDINVKKAVHKIMKDGKVFILKGDKTFNLLGTCVK
ncbi:MAG: hypothetical protein MJZ65_01065 [Paludibacteraceae bacterium]|nr:hypothetical protein [Paludibacteraceae bacterium]